MFTCLTEKPFQFCEIWKQSLVKHFCLSLKSDMVFSLPNLSEIQSNIIFTGLKAQRQIENSVRFKYLSWTLSCWTLKGELEPPRLWEFSNLPQIRRRSESSHKSSFPWMNFILENSQLQNFDQNSAYQLVLSCYNG